MQQFNMVKVFSATKARDRDALGGKITDFLREFKGTIVDTVVTQSSDNEFHCYTLTLFLQTNGNGRRRRSK